MSAPAIYLGALRRAYFSDPGIVFYGLLASAGGAAALAHLPWHELLACMLIGWCLYLPEEYFSHVLIFHGTIPRSRFLYRMLYRLHLGHHDKPRRLDLLFTPLWYTMPSLLLNLGLFYAVTGQVWRSAALATGLTVGYLLFEWWHLIVHSPYEPGPVMRYIRHRHMGHHHWNEQRWFTITPMALLFDVVFRTGGEVHTAPRRASPQTSGLRLDDERLLGARQHYRGRSDWNEDESAIWQLVPQQAIP